MPIYEAEFLGEPVPIRKKKTPRAKKPIPAPELEVQLVSPTELKPKRVRKRKETEPESKVAVPVQVATPPPSETAEPEKKKRIRKKVEPTPDQEKIAVADVEPVKKVNKRAATAAAKAANKKIIVEGDVADEPPSWFKAYLHEEQKRRNADKPKKERASAPAVKQAAEVQAAVKWSDGLTRDRVNNEVNGHMNRLYAQIHGRR
jgi:hypothetical protein